MVSGKGNNSREVDFEEVGKLVDALERDLEKIGDDSRDVQRLKDEVQTLKNVLHSSLLPLRDRASVLSSVAGGYGVGACM